MTTHTDTLIMRNLSAVTKTEWVPFGPDHYATTKGTVTLIAGGRGRNWELTVGRVGWAGGDCVIVGDWYGLVTKIREAVTE